VLMMVLFAQSESTLWIAILLSADGNPQGKGKQPQTQITAETAQ